MDTGALLEQLKSQVSEIERFQQLIHKPKTQSSKFSAAVVEKVVKDNMAKSQDVASKLLPLTSHASDAITGLRGKRDGVMVGSQEAKFALQEIELRHVIGEYDDEEYATLAADPREIVAQADNQIAELEGQVASLEGALQRWQEIGGAAGLL
jgi:hypothetical protein